MGIRVTVNNRGRSLDKDRLNLFFLCSSLKSLLLFQVVHMVLPKHGYSEKVKPMCPTSYYNPIKRVNEEDAIVEWS